MKASNHNVFELLLVTARASAENPRHSAARPQATTPTPSATITWPPLLKIETFYSASCLSFLDWSLALAGTTKELVNDILGHNGNIILISIVTK